MNKVCDFQLSVAKALNQNFLVYPGVVMAAANILNRCVTIHSAPVTRALNATGVMYFQSFAQRALLPTMIFNGIAEAYHLAKNRKLKNLNVFFKLLVWLAKVTLSTAIIHLATITLTAYVEFVTRHLGQYSFL